MIGQITLANPASSVCGPKHIIRKGRSMLEPADARALLYSVDVTMPIELRHRTLIGLMVYSFAHRGGELLSTVQCLN
jgi:hypothetical protein